MKKKPRARCEYCGEEYPKKKTFQRFCGDGCRYAYHNARTKEAREYLAREEAKKK